MSCGKREDHNNLIDTVRPQVAYVCTGTKKISRKGAKNAKNFSCFSFVRFSRPVAPADGTGAALRGKNKIQN